MNPSPLHFLARALLSSVDRCVVSRRAPELHRRAREVNNRGRKLSRFILNVTLVDVNVLL